jgi:ER degradation enhancer, mannosidase alpha-like 2
MREVTSYETTSLHDFTSQVLQNKASEKSPPLSSSHNLIESIWRTFKETFENTATSLTTSNTVKNTAAAASSLQDEQVAIRAQRQREEMVNRRTLLFHKSVTDHYTQQVLQISSPAAAALWNDVHSQNSIHGNSNQQQQQQARYPKQKSDPSSSQKKHKPGERFLPQALRWQQQRQEFICYCFTESTDSYWSFQWCPGSGELLQGRLDRTTGVMQPLYRVGKFQRSSDPTALEQVKNKYPEALAVGVYNDGDVCQNDRHEEVPRHAVMVVHDAKTADRCTFAESGNDSHAEFIIERVDEAHTCMYLFHVCKLSSSASDETQGVIDGHRSSTVWDVSSLSKSEAKLWNRTMLAAQHIMSTYQHETHVDAHRRATADVLTSLSTGLPPMPPSRIRSNLKLVKDMFMHAYDSYMYHGYPASEVKPITCKPATFDLVKIPGLTLIDSLDTLILMSNYTEFARAVERLRYLNDHVTEETGLFSAGGLFAINQNVSVFETNIRVLGGLLSAHQLAVAYLQGKVFHRDVYAKDGTILMGRIENENDCNRDDGHQYDNAALDCSGEAMSKCQPQKDTVSSCLNVTTSKTWKYDGFLLDLARDIGDRLLPAYKTQTGIPYGTVNLLSGVPKGETTVASLAGGGTLSLEMELLSRLTGDETYGRSAKLAARALWMRRSQLDLFGKHICTRSGDWTEYLSGIGSNSDSFYEYLIKHHVLFPEDEDFWFQFVSAYSGVYEQSRLGEWYADVDMRAGAASSGASRRVFEALMAFYPGLQVLLGDIAPAARTLNSFFLVREYLGFLPERFNYGNWRVDSNGGIHLLRPEILESAYFLHRSTKGLNRQLGSGENASALGSSSWQWAGDFAVHTLEELTRRQCGYASPRDVSASTTGAIYPEKERARFSNEMPSYFLSETLKYLFLLFDDGNAIHIDNERDWVFTTEAHPFHHQRKPKSVLDTQKITLKERLERRIKKADPMKPKSWEALKHEKWTHLSDEKSFREQLGDMQDDLRNIFEARRMDEYEDGVNPSYSPFLVEPVVPREMFSGIFDTFNERHQDANPSYLSLRNLGTELDLTMSCSNPYQSDFLWIAALNGGIVDYSQVYMSRVQDEVTVPNFRTGFLGSIDALAFLGSGLHISSIYDADSVCPVRVASKVDGKELSLSEAKPSNSRRETQNGPSRFEMGEVGSFEVSAFPEGSGFLIQHVESGETIVTTLLNDGDSNPGKETESYVLVYNSESADPAAHRSVVMADLYGNAYSCMVELMEILPPTNEEPVCVPVDNERENAPDAEIANGKFRTVAQFPCAPALFGPTNISNLKTIGAISVEAAVQAPILGEEYGCSKKGGVPDQMLGEPSAMAEGGKNSEPRGDVCENSVVSLVHRGICTFQEKSMSQKATFNAMGVIVINTEEDELFVMSGGGTDEKDVAHTDFPVTVLVTGTDGQAILDTIESHEADKPSPLHSRISLVQDQAGLTQTESGLAIAGSKFWPAVIGGPEAIQIFSRSGWGVHATKRQRQDRAGEVEWQLLLMTHHIVDEE